MTNDGGEEEERTVSVKIECLLETRQKRTTGT